MIVKGFRFLPRYMFNLPWEYLLEGVSLCHNLGLIPVQRAPPATEGFNSHCQSQTWISMWTRWSTAEQGAAEKTTIPFWDVSVLRVVCNNVILFLRIKNSVCNQCEFVLLMLYSHHTSRFKNQFYKHECVV